MRDIWLRFRDKYFGAGLDFRARVFNLVTIIGILNGLFTAPLWTFLFMQGEGATVRPGIILPAIQALFLWYANKSGKYQLCFWIHTIILRMIFPGFGFFNNGGYSGGMLLTFAYNVAIAAIIFKGKSAIIVPLILLAQYIALGVYGYHNPHTIHYLEGHKLFLFNLTTFSSISVAFFAIMILYAKLHDRQTRVLEEARKKAVEYERFKSQFFNEINHEFRTSLSVIVTSADMAYGHISSGKITDGTRAYIKQAYDEALRLGGITGFVLASLKMPPEGMKNALALEAYNFEPIRADDFAIIVSGMMRPVAQSKGIALHTETEDNIPQIAGDRNALIQLMQNLLQNAISHSECKTITVRAYQKDNKAVLTIEDDGTGIPPDLLPRVFDQGVSGKGSTGLGLHICKNIVQAHKGEITIENRPNNGTRVTVVLPLTV